MNPTTFAKMSPAEPWNGAQRVLIFRLVLAIVIVGVFALLAAVTKNLGAPNAAWALLALSFLEPKVRRGEVDDERDVTIQRKATNVTLGVCWACFVCASSALAVFGSREGMVPAAWFVVMPVAGSLLMESTRVAVSFWMYRRS